MVTWHGPCQMTLVTLLDTGYWHLSQFIVYGGGGMLWRLPGQSTPRTADPPPARLVTQPPTGTAAPATNPHSGKTNASHAQLMMGGLPFLSTFLWFYELLHSLFASVISLSWGLCRCPVPSVHWWRLTRLSFTCPTICLRSRSYNTPCQHLHTQRVELMGLIFNAGFMRDTLHI